MRVSSAFIALFVGTHGSGYKHSLYRVHHGYLYVTDNYILDSVFVRHMGAVTLMTAHVALLATECQPVFLGLQTPTLTSAVHSVMSC